MKKILLLFLLTSIFAIGQEKLTVNNETEIFDNNGKLFRFYGHGAELDLVKKYDNYAEVKIDGEIYRVEAKFYTPVPKKTIQMGMSISDLVSILGPADNTMSSETKNKVYWTYVYGNSYYHFEDSKLVAINRY